MVFPDLTAVHSLAKIRKGREPQPRLGHSPLLTCLASQTDFASKYRQNMSSLR